MATKIKAGSSIREVLASKMLRAPVFKRRLMRELHQNGDSVPAARAAIDKARTKPTPTGATP